MQPASPPHVVVDESPLHAAIDKNKESLKVKLMMRRPINQLVAQGIMPPLKTPPGFHEQRQKLERAKMGDLLKAKIQQRPDREELVRQHILEETGNVDPSLAEKQRQLKRCRLADALNDQLSHRPGPLELIQKNILHTDEPIERAVKQGLVPFKATSEGSLRKPTPPDHYMVVDEDSSSLSGREGSPQAEPAPIIATVTAQAEPPPPTAALSIQSVPTVGGSVAGGAGIVTVVLTPLPLATGTITTGTGTLTSGAVYAAQSPATSSSPAASSPRSAASPASASSPAPQRDKPRKKSKSKASAPKARTIKFHEYKGPPSAQKAATSSSAGSNSINGETPYELLLQQQQLFLQWQLEWQHKYPQILLPAKPESPPRSPPPPPPPPPHAPPPPPQPPQPLRNLEDMKVSDLKAELKRRNLPVSGAKPQLIERLKPFSDQPAPSPNEEPSLNGNGLGDDQRHREASTPELTPQQRKINLLQRQLQSHINQQAFQQQEEVGERRTSAKASLAAFLQQQARDNNNSPLVSDRQRAQQPLARNAANNAANNDNRPQQQRVGILPNFMGTFVNNQLDLIKSENEALQKCGLIDIKPADLKNDIIKQEPMDGVKSQIVDDVLEILIKNGELPASALDVDTSLLDPAPSGESGPNEAPDVSGLVGSDALDMDVDAELMDVDTDWLDSLIEAGHMGADVPQPTRTRHRGDPLLGQPPSPNSSLDLFMDDSDLPLSPPSHIDFPWDRVDFAT